MAVATAELCDRCPASAAATLVLATGSLAFCQHHTNEYSAVLNAQGTVYTVAGVSELVSA